MFISNTVSICDRQHWCKVKAGANAGPGGVLPEGIHLKDDVFIEYDTFAPSNIFFDTRVLNFRVFFPRASARAEGG